MAVVMVAIAATVYEIFVVEICTILILTFKMYQAQMQICRLKLKAELFYLIVTVMFVQSAIVYDI